MRLCSWWCDGTCVLYGPHSQFHSMIHRLGGDQTCFGFQHLFCFTSWIASGSSIQLDWGFDTVYSSATQQARAWLTVFTYKHLPELHYNLADWEKHCDIATWWLFECKHIYCCSSVFLLHYAQYKDECLRKELNLCPLGRKCSTQCTVLSPELQLMIITAWWYLTSSNYFLNHHT